MALTKRSEKPLVDDGPGARLIMLLIWSYGITSVAAVDIGGFVFSTACRDESAYLCVGIPPSDCCAFIGTQTIQSVQYTGVPIGNMAYSWDPSPADPGCGTIHQAQACGRLPLCLRSRTRGLTGGSWSTATSLAVSEDGTTVPIAKCKNVVKPILMKFNATTDSWYPVDNETSISSTHRL